MRIGYLECFAGISGDMLLGALVGAGVPPGLLTETAASLNLGATLSFESVDRSGISARKARVLMDGREADAPQHHDHPHGHNHQHDHDHAGHAHTHGRNLPAIREILNNAPLPAEARALALRAFELLGQSEAAIHNVPLDQVHFHEVGAVDAIIDITCAAVGLTSLHVDRWYSSPVMSAQALSSALTAAIPFPPPLRHRCCAASPHTAKGRRWSSPRPPAPPFFARSAANSRALSPPSTRSATAQARAIPRAFPTCCASASASRLAKKTRRLAGNRPCRRRS